MFPVFDATSGINSAPSTDSLVSKINDVPLKPTRSDNSAHESAAHNSINGYIPIPLASSPGFDIVEEDCIDIEMASGPSAHSPFKPSNSLPPLAPETGHSELDSYKTPAPSAGLGKGFGSSGTLSNLSSTTSNNHRFSPMSFANYLFGGKKLAPNADLEKKVAYIVVQFSALQDFKP